ncbi:MAG: hypothetical protein RLZZ490_1065 [Cyanobacteriota bacterium]|jgi:hypothetical protein
MFNYHTQYSVSPSAIAIDLQITPASGSPLAKQPSQWQWRYQFRDGSQLRGNYCGFFSPASGPIGHLPTWQIQQVGSTEYFATDKQTPLLQWQPDQFVCYELGEELLLLASNDNYVSNSLCLVNSPHRQWAQVTHWGSRLVAESFTWNQFSIHCLEPKIPNSWRISWQFSPFFVPFFYWRLTPAIEPTTFSSLLQPDNFPWVLRPMTSIPSSMN